MDQHDEKDVLPETPQIGITVEETTDSGPGFLKVVRSKAKFAYPDDSISELVTMDRIVRRSDDAVAIIAFGQEDLHAKVNEPYIFLRSAIRPALALRDFEPTGLPESPGVGCTWEVPAGLVDAGEEGVDGVLHAAQRELEEEVGFQIELWKFFFLGKRSFPAVGLSGERIFFVAVEVSEYQRKEPSLDGSPFELHGQVVPVKLSVAKRAVSDGYIYDTKTEIAIRRLIEFLNG